MSHCKDPALSSPRTHADPRSDILWQIAVHRAYLLIERCWPEIAYSFHIVDESTQAVNLGKQPRSGYSLRRISPCDACIEGRLGYGETVFVQPCPDDDCDSIQTKRKEKITRVERRLYAFKCLRIFLADSQHAYKVDKPPSTLVRRLHSGSVPLICGTLPTRRFTYTLLFANA